MVKPNARNPSLTSQESYSAVIIADLVAEVPVISDTAQDCSKTKVEETNLGYDGHMDGEAASQAGTESRQNGTGIAKGVILNAVQFGQADSKRKWDEKPSQLPKMSVVEVQAAKPTGFKDMSLSRKLVFGFSFLPSILFVLCFAIILPCNIPVKAPCVKELWTTPFNDTEVTSSLQIPQNIIFTLSNKGQHFLVTLDVTNGSTLNKEKLLSAPIYLQCNSDANTQRMCIVMDDNGKLYVFNASNGELMWTRNVREEVRPSLPVYLSDCNGDGEDEVAVAVSKTKFQVIYNDNTSSSFSISNCDSVPERLTSWPIKNSSDIIFFCKSNEKDVLMRVPREAWCKEKNPNENESEVNANIMFSRMPGIRTSKEYILNPLEDGLLLWLEDEVVMLLPNNTQKWTASSDFHSHENRFVLDGKFISGNMEVALFSSDNASNMKVTVLTLANGNIVTNKSFSDYGTTEGKRIRGKERDFVLLLLQKMKNDLKTEALTHINDISSTVISFISNENISEPIAHFESSLSEEVAFMDLIENVSLHSLKERDAVFKSTLTADYDGINNILNVYLLTSLKSEKNIEVTKIKIENWDISTAKEFQCPA